MSLQGHCWTLHLGLLWAPVRTSELGVSTGCSAQDTDTGFWAVPTPSLLHIYLRRRFPTTTLHRTTRRSWCYRSCQRWIQEPSISGEAGSGRGQGTLSMKTKQCPHPGLRGPLPLSTYAEAEQPWFPKPLSTWQVAKREP